MKKIIIVATDDQAKIIVSLLMDTVSDITVKHHVSADASPGSAIERVKRPEPGHHPARKRSLSGKTSDEVVVTAVQAGSRTQTEITTAMISEGFAPGTFYGTMQRVLSKGDVYKRTDGTYHPVYRTVAQDPTPEADVEHPAGVLRHQGVELKYDPVPTLTATTKMAEALQTAKDQGKL